jgi:hypothetical protein
VDGTACVSLALILWLMQAHINPRAAAYFRCVAIALVTAIVVWILIKSWAIVSSVTPPTGHTSLGATHIRDIFGLRIPAVLFGALLWWRIRTSRTIWAPTLLSAILAALSIYLFPAAFKQSRTLASPSDISEFSDWTNAIAPTSTVLVAPARDVGAFVWFTLTRPNYLALDQSSGVVFSRETALEVQRRSQVLLPLMNPDWKILTSLRASAAAAGKQKLDAAIRPLSVQGLMLVCTDPRLGYVISPENVGFDPLRHKNAGAWKDWNLYDCRKVRSQVSTT